MLTELTLGEKLKDLRLENGYPSTVDLEKAINIPSSTLGNYEDDDKNQNIGYANLVTLAKFYGVSTDWLLGLSSVERHLNTEYIDLGLNDDVIDILRAKTINTRLLNDFILDPHFDNLIADMEIYINGMISMRITALNSQLKSTRNMIMKKHNMTKDDINTRTFLLGQFDEKRYFNTIIAEDIDKILISLRKKYSENDKDHSVTSSEIDLEKMTLDAVDKYRTTKGSKKDRETALLSAFTGTNPSKMNTEEKNAQSSFFKSLTKFWKKK